MDPIDTTRLLGEVRRLAPRTIRSALSGLGEILEEILRIDGCALEIPSERTVYISKPQPGIDDDTVYEALKLPKGSGYRRIVLGRDKTTGAAIDGGGLSVYTIPIFSGRDRAAIFFMICRNERAFGGIGEDEYAALVETLSAILNPFIAQTRSVGERQQARSMRTEILESVGDELMMRGALLRMMELSQAEFCAFYSELSEGHFYIMLEGSELSPRIPEIRDKLRNTFLMFSNQRDGEEILYEKVFVKRRERNLAHLLGSVKIESYFIVPVTFDAKVRGVLFFGSVKKDAFTREDIAAFNRLAEEGEERAPLRFRVGGEMGILERIVGALPFGCALIASNGEIKYANDDFRRILEIRGHPETVQAIHTVSPFNLHGLSEEFGVLERDIIERELQSVIGHERTVAVTWVRIGDISEEVDSLILLKDISHTRDQEEAREEMLATVAHELRTPMTALKNSLVIMREGCDSPVSHGDASSGPYDSRFLGTALRTVKRLTDLVDGIVDASTFRVPDYTLRPVRVEMIDFLEESSCLFAESMRKKEIGFDIRVQPSASSLVLDRDRMEQVIQNLLSNSMKHVPSGGEISITVTLPDGIPDGLFPRIPWDYLWRPDFACISVRDTGSGIPEGVIEEINRQNRGAEGNVRPLHGLGLYIATRLVRRHGGALRIKRDGEWGSAVAIYLPRRVETGRVIRVVRSIERIVTEMITRGASPVLYSIVRTGSRPWHAIAADMRTAMVVNPTKNAVEREGYYLWPLGRDYAVAVAAPDTSVINGVSVAQVDAREVLFIAGHPPVDVDIGWGVAPRDGTSYGELVERSLERIGIEPVFALQKGEIG
jgi:signal transduction histidine kinase